MSRPSLPSRLETEPESIERDLMKLVLTVIELIRQLMEKQALRRVEGGDLEEGQVEALGLGLKRLEQAMGELKERYSLTAADLDLDLGPLGSLLRDDWLAEATHAGSITTTDVEQYDVEQYTARHRRAVPD
jgi:hypothetical protein